MGLQLELQQSKLLVQVPPAALQGVSHQPSAFFTRPMQQSLVVFAAPPHGAQVVRHRASWLVADDAQYGALAQQGRPLLPQSLPLGRQVFEQTFPAQVPEQHWVGEVHDWPFAVQAASHSPSALRTRPLQQSALDEALPPWGTQVVRQVQSWLAVVAPQVGAAAQQAEREEHGWPATTQLGGARQMPWASSVVPAQQSLGCFARIPSVAQVAWHEGVPPAVVERQYGAVAQHGEVLVAHELPDARHDVTVAQTPLAFRERPEQQSLEAATCTPAPAHAVWHANAPPAPAWQKGAEPQHALELVQALPAEAHAAWHTPFTQVTPLQQGDAPPQD